MRVPSQIQMAFQFRCLILRSCVFSSPETPNVSKISENHSLVRWVTFAVLFVFWSAFPPAPASAQQNHPVASATGAEEPASLPQDSYHSELNMPRQEQAGPQLPSPHEGSGTAWQPAAVEETEWMLDARRMGTDGARRHLRRL